ncbi:hypothetical protein ACODT5_02020 [Streptomyces sp. 5.8]|uniref:hypothetical protein n=1 Tax=Streptomyces sp. 5.8 TaxID=3406571 RepID=UPI003BB5A7A4
MRIKNPPVVVLAMALASPLLAITCTTTAHAQMDPPRENSHLFGCSTPYITPSNTEYASGEICWKTRDNKTSWILRVAAWEEGNVRNERRPGQNGAPYLNTINFWVDTPSGKRLLLQNAGPDMDRYINDGRGETRDIELGQTEALQPNQTYTFHYNAQKNTKYSQYDNSGHEMYTRPDRRTVYNTNSKINDAYGRYQGLGGQYTFRTHALDETSDNNYRSQ